MSITHGYSGSAAKPIRGAYTPEYFDGCPYPIGENTKTRRIDQATKIAGELAQASSLSDREQIRLAVTDGMYQWASATGDLRGPELVLGCAVKTYTQHLGATILDGVERSRRKVNVRTPDAIRKIGGRLVEQETIDRLRTLDGGFLTTVLAEQRHLPRLTRLFRGAKFLSTYPDRPSDVLLKGHDQLDTGSAQVQYGTWAAAKFAAAFEHIGVGYNPEDIKAGVVEVLQAIVAPSVSNEMHATRHALKGALGE